MVNASKILTVSYGTFSCTLEGFDDPFSTMRSIAEYFRDLAADDRYFGAEPPTPDAEMLHRIAEKEINRRVEAKVNKNGVVLRQIEDGDSASRPAAAPAPKPRREEARIVDAPQLDDAAHESVAEKLRRIRAAVARRHVEPQFADAFGQDEDDGALDTARSIDSAFVEPEVAPEAVPEAVPEVSQDVSLAETDIEEFEPEEVAVAAPEEAKADAIADLPDEDLADELPEAVAEDSAEAVDAPEDTIAELTEEPVEEDIQIAIESPEISADDAFEDEVVEADDADDLNIDALFAEDDSDNETAVDAEVAPEMAEAIVEDSDSEEAAEAQGSDDFDIDTLTSILNADDTPETEEASLESEADPIVEDVSEATAPVPRARIVKMSRRDFMERYVEVEATIEDEEEAADVSPDKIRASLGDTGLSPEDEDDLINELVAVERDALEGSEDDTATDDASDAPLVLTNLADDPAADAPGEKPAQPVEEIAATLAAAVAPKDTGELAVDRLLRQADSELQDNDSSRRRSAISHLKAAVAAVRADGGRVRQDVAAEDARTMDKFRKDLAEVVRPEPGAAAPEAPAEPKPIAAVKPVLKASDASETPRPRRRMPPLMLVSEQRIDKPEGPGPDATPVRPRRVQADDVDDATANELFEDSIAGAENAAGNLFSNADDFRGYVAETGAEGVQELLEASAAFGTLVEDNAFNSRPQIMQRVLTFVPDGTLTREEGLRAFGVLLREGRLVRVRRGQFVLPDKSRFREDRKTAAG